MFGGGISNSGRSRMPHRHHEAVNLKNRRRADSGRGGDLRPIKGSDM